MPSISSAGWRWEEDKEIVARTYQWHLGIAKLSPQVLSGVQAYQRSDEEPNKLDTADTADADARHEEPEEPFGFEAVAALVMELGPAESSGHSTAKQHRIEENKTADGRVGVLAEDHEGNKPYSRSTEMQFACGPVGHGHTKNTEQGIEGAHKGEVDLFGVLFARLEFERPIVSSQDARQAD